MVNVNQVSNQNNPRVVVSRPSRTTIMTFPINVEVGDINHSDVIRVGSIPDFIDDMATISRESGSTVTISLNRGIQPFIRERIRHEIVRANLENSSDVRLKPEGSFVER